MEKVDNEILEKLNQIQIDISFIKERLSEDFGEELSDWAKEELEISRKVPEGECVNHEDVKRLILDGIRN